MSIDGGKTRGCVITLGQQNVYQKRKPVSTGTVEEFLRRTTRGPSYLQCHVVERARLFESKFNGSMEVLRHVASKGS